MLTKLGEGLEEPFNKFMQFKDATTKTLENICGHYVESKSSPCMKTSDQGVDFSLKCFLKARDLLFKLYACIEIVPV